MSGKRTLLLAGILFLLLFAAAPSALFAQTASSGLVSGVVTDPSGAAVPNATVTLEQHATGLKQTTQTDSTGRYAFPAVDPSDYTVKFSAQGFQAIEVSQLHVEVQKAYSVDMKMTIGAATETVTVTGVPTADLQTTTATVGAVLGGDSLENLPVFTRSASALMFYQPAVAPSGQISGARDEQVTFNLDGGDVTSDLEGSNSYAAPPGEPSPSPVLPVPIESTEEFQVATTNPNSTFSRSSGGQVALITKRGTNSYHGSIYEFHNDDGLNANGWSNDRLGLHKPHTVDNRFGFTAGGPILKQRVWFFANYEGRRLEDDSQFNAVVPTASLQSGVLRFRDTAGNINSFSFAPGSITTACGGVSCDPRNLGFNPVIKSQLALYPAGNNSTLGDGLNTTGFTFNAPTPISQNLAVLRLDGKISTNWTAFVTAHYSKIDRVSTSQITLLGTPGSISSDPIYPTYYTFEVTGQLSPNFTSVTHGSFLRDWWGWNRVSPSPLVSGTTAALALAGEGSGASNSTAKLIADPVNLATQSARFRVFNGKKWYLAQDFSWLKGNHLWQFGGSGYIAHDYFVKSDNFAGGLTAGPINYIESTGNGSGVYLAVPSADEPATCSAAITVGCLQTSDVLRWNELYSTLLGLVDRSSQVLTRNGKFQPNPLGTPAFSQTTIPALNGYVQDVWKLRPSLTVTLGLDWGAQPGPTEATGKYDVLVYAGTNTPVDYWQWITNRANSLNNGVTPGQAYNPLFGVTPVNSLADPWKGKLRVTDWHEFGPRVSTAWQVPFQNKIFGNNNTVIRAGYALVYDRMSDINQVSLPLTTGGLLDVDACGGPVLSGGSLVCTNGATNPSTAFRIGIDGNNIPVPTPTAVPIPYVVSGTAAAPFGLFMQSGLDPYATQAHSHSVDFTIQRALPGKMLFEAGFIGRYSRNLPQDIALNSSDYLMKDSASGQTFGQAFDVVAQALRINGKGAASIGAIPAQPFFDNQIGLAFCKAQPTKISGLASFANCAQMVAAQDPTDLINGSLNMFALNEFNRVTPVPVDNIQSFQSFGITDRGFSNYNAGFVSMNKSFANGLQFQANWTWSHAIGNQGVDQQSGSSANSPFNLNLDKSSETFDRRHVVNIWYYYTLPFGKGTRYTFNDSRILDLVAGGWYTSGIYQFSTGVPLHISANGDYGAYEGSGTAAICTQTLHGLEGENFGVVGSGGVSTSGNSATGGSGANIFSNPVAVFASCSRPLISVISQIPFDQLRALPRWNFDFSLGKTFSITERFKLDFSGEFLNVFNNVVFGNPSLSLNSASNFGVFSSQANSPRRVLLGLKLKF